MTDPPFPRSRRSWAPRARGCDERHNRDRRTPRRIAWDLPGLGLAERPAGFDYSWGLGRFCRAAADAFGLERFHLVVHDIGGPVGFELAAAAPARVASLTILNTMIEVDRFRRPWSMEPFARRGNGEVYLRTLTKPAFPYPVQIVWGERDPALKLSVHAEQVRRAAGLTTSHRVPAKHFLQGDQAGAIAERVLRLARAG